jgi:hypothetical protein
VFSRKKEAHDMLRMLSVLLLIPGLVLAADPFLGTWKINTAKSKYSPGPAPKGGTITFTEEGGWIIGKNETVSADGTTSKRNNRYKLDGKEYPFDSPSGKGTISVKANGERERTSTLKLADGSTLMLKTVISSDGKTRTMTTTGKNAQGQAVKNVVVYDRQ